MPINLRRFEVADSSITAAKLADGSVILENSKVTGTLPVTKASEQLKTSLIIGDDTEVFSLLRSKMHNEHS